MKKALLAMLVVAVAVGFAVRAYSAEVKETVTTKGDTTVEKTEVKSGDIRAKETVKTTPEATTTETKMKGKEAKYERKTVETEGAEAGKAKFKTRHGALKELSVEWDYIEEMTSSGNMVYKLRYTVKDKGDKELIEELNLTPEQARAIKPGTHEIVSTSPYTAEDVRADFRAVILKDLRNATLSATK